MKKIISIIFLAIVFNANANDDFYQISLTPYIEESLQQHAIANDILLDKLNQIALYYSMSGNSIVDRFVITANTRELEKVCMSTTPVKYAVQLMLSIYIGDGDVGTLFSTYSTEIKGVGDSFEEAYVNAYRKIDTNNQRLLNSVKKGYDRIHQYYEANYNSILQRSNALANQGKYDEAIYNLFTIPSTCSGFQQAQELAAQLATEENEKYNEKILTNAMACWAASSNYNGARRAQEILDGLKSPSNEVLSKAQKLTNEMAKWVQNLEEQENKIEFQRIQNEHKENMAQIKADAQTTQTKIRAKSRENVALINATSQIAQTHIKAKSNENIARVNAARDIAVSYYNSRPRTVYHFHWW